MKLNSVHINIQHNMHKNLTTGVARSKFLPFFGKFINSKSKIQAHYKVKKNRSDNNQNPTMGNLKNLPISSLSNNGQPRNLTKQTRSRPINQTNQKVQKHSTVQTHQQIQSQPISWIKTPL